MPSGPEQAMLIAFERQYPTDAFFFYRAFNSPNLQTQVNNFCTAIALMGTPFAKESHKPMALNAYFCVDKNVISTFRSMKATGSIKYAEYLKDVVGERTMPINEPIKRNNFHIF